MHYSKDKIKRNIKPDASTHVIDYGWNISDGCDAIFVNIDGYHGRYINSLSTKNYFVVSGEIQFEVEGERTKVTESEIFSIPPNKAHSMQGMAKIVEICSPPFNPETEKEIK